MAVLKAALGSFFIHYKDLSLYLNNTEIHMKLKNIFFLCLLFSCFGFSWPFLSGANNTTNSYTSTSSSGWVNRETQILISQARNFDSHVLRLALTAYKNAQKKGYTHKRLLTVIDYSKPSSQKRMLVVDLNRNRVLFNTFVSHGKNSGALNATSFSNNPGSLKSSIGVFVTDQTYQGKNGYSLRLRGLEKGINDSAYSRAIVIHGAPYANPANIGRNGRLGLSWGCPAVEPTLAKPIINTIKQGSVVFAYSPDRRWLSHSSFLSA